MKVTITKEETIDLRIEDAEDEDAVLVVIEDSRGSHTITTIYENANMVIHPEAIAAVGLNLVNF